MQRLAVMLVLLVGLAARAQNPCAPDVKQFCANVKPGGGRVVRCLEDNQERVTPVCRAKLAADTEKAKGYIAEFSAACQADTERLCSDVRPGGGRMLKCLARNDYALSPACTAELNKFDLAREKVTSLERLCKADVESLCAQEAGHAGELLACLRTNQEELSPGCRSADPALAYEAATLVDTVDEMTSEARIQDTVDILQGLNSVAFSRNQIAISFDYFQSITGLLANVDQLTFNPLFVFGKKKEFAVSFKVPVAALFPTESGRATVSGVSNVNTAFGWAFYAHKGIRQYLAVALQWNSASEPLVGAPWVITPVYAIAVGLAGWVSLTVELSWNKSFGYLGNYAGVNLLVLRPIVAFNLPAFTFLAVDTKLGWDFVKHIFVPVMRFQGGKLFGRDHDVSIAAWYQLSLTTEGQRDSYEFGVGLSLTYFFKW